VVVERGDSFWSIAVEEAGERELVRYWRALIEANRDRLVDPSNPDLLHPGQVLRLP
jgi:nucleoid-associated protein YgaU